MQIGMSSILADTDIPHGLYFPRILALPLLLFCEGVTIYRYSEVNANYVHKIRGTLYKLTAHDRTQFIKNATILEIT
jgi:hypothetical protein